MLSKKFDETHADAKTLSDSGRCISTEMPAKLAVAQACPKWDRCSAAYCPALGPTVGGKHYAGERVCSYLLESVKEGGQARLREYLPKQTVDLVVREGLRLLNSTGPLKKPLTRATKSGSRVQSIKRAATFRGQP